MTGGGSAPPAEACRAIVFDPASRRLDERELPLRPLAPGEVLVRVSLSAICGSDLHTMHGRRDPGGPLVLGHEICGTVAALGEAEARDFEGETIRVGDRVTWSIAASCGRCLQCARGIPQKCLRLFKYGHETLDSDTPLSGGFAEYCYLAPGTAIFRLPDEVPDAHAVFANCALATMQAAVRMAAALPDEEVLIQGAGTVGLCAAAAAAARGARVTVVDPCQERLALAESFGAAATAVSVPANSAFDAAIEACGVPGVVADGISALRIGGRYILAGCVFPGAQAEVDLQAVTTKLLQIGGLHNYTPLDLHDALRLIARRSDTFAFDEVVREVFALGEIDAALELMESDPSVLRVALRP